MVNSRSTARRWWAPVSIGVIAAAMIAVVVFSDSGPRAAVEEGSVADAPAPEGQQDSHAAVEEPQRLHIERRDPSDPLAIGDVDAPVTIVAVSDFQCGFCALWSAQTLPTMLEYVQAGDVRIEWRDVAILGQPSYDAALAAYAAGLQGEYFAFNQAIFADGSAPSPSMLTDEGLQAVAADLDLDLEQFNSDRVGEPVATAVQANMAEATSIGVTGTPTFLINGQGLSGAQPTDLFTSIIETELAAHS